ncbi:MAG TPA: sn-glycerol-3-phosphate ABC transporter ATP-binding protein UgpC [Burkholderiaceae bacterium]|nr:sn-glycerol-3-phosphate ABC transporter ATP-binding protein UgpC [Burkholderiaceae bacterium]
MTSMRLIGIQKRFGAGVPVLHGIDLDIAAGEFMVFVGPSGCGKTTLLRCIAGLEEVSAGRLLIGDQEAQDLPPVQREVAMVFQSYALYPHMTVAENLGFALKFGKLGRAEREQAVQRAAEILQITPLLARKPGELSGGQRQRVAIGRAIVRKPRAFLFDEPLSNLDAALRVQMRMELARLHRELGTTMVYVTHDQVEAMTLGTRIAVFNAGRIEQVGRPIDLYRKPATQFVAGFLGSPRMSFLSGTASAQGDGIRLAMGDAGSLLLPLRPLLGGGPREVTLGVRPEHMHIVEGHGLRAVIEQIEHLGDCDLAYARLAGREEVVTVRLPVSGFDLVVGATVCLHPDVQDCHLFDLEGNVVGAR